MKIKAQRPVDIEVDAIRLRLPLRYTDEEDCIAADFPGRDDTVTTSQGHPTLTLTLDLATGTVRDWPAGREEELHEKVCDEGIYELLSGEVVVATIHENYVPICVPEGGKYVVITIDGAGQVFDEGGGRWVPDADDIAQSFFPSRRA